jgi:nicotinamide riboside transporter PnuC
MDLSSINWVGELFDTIVSLSGKYGRWLNARGKRVCFLIWSIVSVYWSIRDFKIGLYSQAIFCIFSIALNLYGFFNWGKTVS